MANQQGRAGGGKPQQHLLAPIVSKPYPDGDEFKVNIATWYKENNRPYEGRAILLYVDLVERAEGKTDKEGHVMWTLGGLLPGQTYSFAVKVKGWGSPVNASPVSVPEEKEDKKPALTVKIDESFQPRETKKGWDFTTVATVTEGSKPLPNAAVEFYLDGISAGQDITDGQGRVVKILDLDQKRMTSRIETVLPGTTVRDSLKVLVPRVPPTEKPAPRKIDNITINRLRLNRSEAGTEYQITIQTLDEKCAPIPNVEIEVTDPSNLRRMKKTTTDERGLAVYTVKTSEPKCRFAAIGGGVSKWEWLFHDAHLVKT
jgi:hypothetical protein